MRCVEAHIARIEAVDGRLNAVVARRFDDARAEADAVDAARARGETLGPLAGVPITVKEQFDVEGLATTFGLPTPRRRAARRRTGRSSTRLRDAGAIILGKTNVAELLFYQEGDNPLFGRTNNPWDLERTSGGGSGGEGAIIAAGGSPLGLAADIGGSIRTPAHFCGIQGLRPTSGRLTNLDSPPELFFPGMEAVILDPGPMARTVADLELAMRVLAAPGLEKLDPRIAPVAWPDPNAVSIEGLRIGVFEDDGYWPASPALRRAVREAAEILTERGRDRRALRRSGPRSRDAASTSPSSWRTGSAGRARLLQGQSPSTAGSRWLMQIALGPGCAAPADREPARLGRGSRASRTGSAGRRSGRHAGTGASWRSAPTGAAGSSRRWTPSSSTRSCARRTRSRRCSTARPTSSTTPRAT